MRPLALALLVAACVGCLHPSPSAPRTRAPLRVAVDADLANYRAYVADGMGALTRGGLPAALVAPGAAWDLYVRHGDAHGAWAGWCCREPHVIELDPVEIHGGLQWRVVAMHEALHAVGVRLHVCRYRGELPADQCNPVGYGPAILNPTLPPPPESCDPFAHACVDNEAQLTLTALDRAALRAAGVLPPAR